MPMITKDARPAMSAPSSSLEDDDPAPKSSSSTPGAPTQEKRTVVSSAMASSVALTASVVVPRSDAWPPSSMAAWKPPSWTLASSCDTKVSWRLWAYSSVMDSPTPSSATK